MLLIYETTLYKDSFSSLWYFVLPKFDVHFVDMTVRNPKPSPQSQIFVQSQTQDNPIVQNE